MAFKAILKEALVNQRKNRQKVRRWENCSGRRAPIVC